MKKIEGSLIKRLLRMSWYLLSIHFGAPFIFSLSLSLWTLRYFLENFSFGHGNKIRQRGREDQARKRRIKQLQQDY